MPQSPLETYMLISVLKYFMLLTCRNPAWLFARSFSVLSSVFFLLCVSYRWHAISSRGMCRILLADSMCINIIARTQGALLNVIVPTCTIVLPSAIGNLILRLKLDVFLLPSFIWKCSIMSFALFIELYEQTFHKWTVCCFSVLQLNKDGDILMEMISTVVLLLKTRRHFSRMSTTY